MARRTSFRELVRIPFRGGDLPAVNVDGELHVSGSHICDALGIDAHSQLRKLSVRPWATIIKLSIAGNSRNRDMSFVDLHTLPMWLATIDADAVVAQVRPLLEAYRAEAAGVLRRYSNHAAAISTQATDCQLSVLRQQAEIVQMLRGIIPDDYLDKKARLLLGRTLGEAQQLDPVRRRLYVHDYLRGRGLRPSEVKSAASSFGMRMRAAYLMEHGAEPATAPQEIHGRVIDVKAYTEADRPLFDRVWRQYFTNRFESPDSGALAVT